MAFRGRQPRARVELDPGSTVLATARATGESPGRAGNSGRFLGRGPCTVESESALMREHRIGLLVTKDSGGPMTAAKLSAARSLGVHVVMVRRPPLPSESTAVATVQEALRWLGPRDLKGHLVRSPGLITQGHRQYLDRHRERAETRDVGSESGQAASWVSHHLVLEQRADALVHPDAMEDTPLAQRCLHEEAGLFRDPAGSDIACLAAPLD
jgi:hypothetical protein